VLKIFHPQHETELHTDASINGFGAVLLQKSPKDKQVHPVYYMSKKTTDAERKFSSYELEILAVVEAFRKFLIYLIAILSRRRLRREKSALESHVGSSNFRSLTLKSRTDQAHAYAMLIF